MISAQRLSVTHWSVKEGCNWTLSQLTCATPPLPAELLNMTSTRTESFICEMFKINWNEFSSKNGGKGKSEKKGIKVEKPWSKEVDLQCRLKLNLERQLLTSIRWYRKLIWRPSHARTNEEWERNSLYRIFSKKRPGRFWNWNMTLLFNPPNSAPFVLKINYHLIHLFHERQSKC